MRESEECEVLVQTTEETTPCGAQTKPGEHFPNDHYLGEAGAEHCTVADDMFEDDDDENYGRWEHLEHQEVHHLHHTHPHLIREPMHTLDLIIPPSSTLKLTKDHDPKKTAIFFDWDDTLLASTHLSMSGYRLDTDQEFSTEVRKHLSALEDSVIQIIEAGMVHGEVVIITNAEKGWVEMSCRKFLPGVEHILSKVEVLSARSTYEIHYPDEPSAWKKAAFDNKLSDMFESLHCKNIISLGDSYAEREAVHHSTRNIGECRTKSVKFVERPTLEQLRKQVDLVHSCMEYICRHEGDLDLMLTLNMVESQS